MTDLLQELALIRALAENDLNPSAFLSKVREWQRGGLPARSMGDAVRGSGERWPIDDEGRGTDAFDRVVAKTRAGYVDDILTAHMRLSRAFRRQNGLLLIPQPAALEEHDCKNPFCQMVHLRPDAFCDRCRQHRHRYGMDWPDKREATG